MEIRSLEFKARAEKAVLDEQLQRNLDRLGARFKLGRDLAFAALADPEALREQGRAMKERSLAHLPQLLEALEARVQEAGGVVHWARTGPSGAGRSSPISRGSVGSGSWSRASPW